MYFSFDCYRLTLALFFFLLRRLPPRPPTFSLEPVWWCLLRRLPRPMTPYCLGKFCVWYYWIIIFFLFSTRVLPGVGLVPCSNRNWPQQLSLSLSLSPSLSSFLVNNYFRGGKRPRICISLILGEKSRRRRRDRQTDRRGGHVVHGTVETNISPFPSGPFFLSFFLALCGMPLVQAFEPSLYVCMYIYILFFYNSTPKTTQRLSHPTNRECINRGSTAKGSCVDLLSEINERTKKK